MRYQPPAAPHCTSHLPMAGGACHSCNATGRPPWCMQLPYMASLARQAYLGSGRRQRGLLVCARSDRMGAALEASKKERQRKRPRTAAAGAAPAEGPQPAGVGAGAGGRGQQVALAGAGRFYPSRGPGNATTFHPPRDQGAAVPPSLAVRKFNFLDMEAGQQEQYNQLAGQARGLDRKDPRRQQLKSAQEQLPGTIKVGACRRCCM